MSAVDEVNVLVKSINIPKLIKEIKKNPVIWDKTSPYYKNRMKVEEAWLSICDNLIPGWSYMTDKMKSYCVSLIKKKWSGITRYYKMNMFQKEGCSRPYVYSRLMYFLRPHYTEESSTRHSNPQRRLAEEDEDDEDGELSDSDLSEHEDEDTQDTNSWEVNNETPTPAPPPTISQFPIDVLVKLLDATSFIEAIKKYPVIWKKKPASRSKIVVFKERTIAWRNICKELIPKWEAVSKDDKLTYVYLMKKKWRNYRDYYRKNIITGRPEFKYEHSELLSFLKPVVTGDPDKIEEDKDYDDAEVLDLDLSACDDECSQDENRGEDNDETEIPATLPSPSQLSVETVVKTLNLTLFVELVKRHPVIWNKPPAGKSKIAHYKERDEVWISIFRELIPKWEDMPNNVKQKYSNKLKKKWMSLRDYYRQNILRGGPEFIYEHSELLSFLKPVYTNDTDKPSNYEVLFHRIEEDRDEEGEVLDNDLSAYEAEDLEETDDILYVDNSKIEPKDPIRTPSTSSMAEPVPKKFRAETSEKDISPEDCSSKSEAEDDDILSVHSFKIKPEDPIQMPSTSGVSNRTPKKLRAELSDKDTSPEDFSSKSEAEDADLMFFRSLLPEITMLDHDQKFDFKLGTMKLLKKLKNNQVVNDSDSD